MMKTMKYGMTSLYMLLLVLLAACQQEEYDSYSHGSKQLSIQCLPARMGVVNVATRAAGDPGDALMQDEQTIHDLHVFLFDTNGDYLQNNSSGSDTPFQGYTHIEGNRSLIIYNDVLESEADNATIYVLANLEEGTVIEPQDDDGIPSLRDPDGGNPIKVTNENVLEAYVYKPIDLSLQLPENGLPMRARLTGQNLLNPAAGNNLIQITLEALMARVDLSFKIHMDEPENVSERYPQYRTQKLTVNNLPISTTFGEVKLTEKTSAGVTNLEEIWQRGPIYHENGTISTSFYIFEHHRFPNGDADYPTDYPSGEDENIYKQRYKPQIAERATNGQGDAVYINIDGTYYTQNAYAYDIAYKLYLGANAVNDFVVQRDRQYKNDVTIKGISATNNPNDPGDVELDTRVNISETAPYYIAMLRERNHDAHFNVTPMDVYVLSEQGYVTVEIENPDANKWIRMEYVGHVSAAGEKKRSYFTTSLLSDLDIEKGKEVTIRDADNNGERIYLYIDENLDWDYQQHQGIDRQVNLIVKYYDSDADTEPQTRNILIMQKGLKLVEIKKNDSGMQYDGYRAVETYEEYDNYFDPKNDFGVTYDGLPWGGFGRNVGSVIGNENGNALTTGWENTRGLMNRIFSDRLYADLNTVPESAVEYCYNKNKRNVSGEVVSVDWYLPAITELEFVVVNYHLDNPDFQTSLYWSSNPAWNSDNRHQHARATRAVRSNADGNVDGWRWVNSEAGGWFGDDDEGYQLRNTEHRIRCVRNLPEGYAPKD